MFLSGVNGVIANSHGTANALGRVIPNTVSVIPNGVDIERFTLVGGPEVFRKELGLPPAGHVVMYVGGFYEWKGVGTLLQAWNEPALRGHSLVLVGGTKEELLRLVDHDRSFSWEGIELFPHQPAELIPRFLHAADVLVLPNAPISEESVSHTSPIKLFEYMASERPIVASDLPSIREIVDENSAVLFKAGDPRSLGGAIVRTLNQGSGLKEMVANAKNIAQKYSWSMRAKRIVDVLSV
jgi:glycosyltransferase involved in cell wall biosynthesis